MKKQELASSVSVIDIVNESANSLEVKVSDVETFDVIKNENVEYYLSCRKLGSSTWNLKRPMFVSDFSDIQNEMSEMYCEQLSNSDNYSYNSKEIIEQMKADDDSFDGSFFTKDGYYHEGHTLEFADDEKTTEFAQDTLIWGCIAKIEFETEDDD